MDKNLENKIKEIVSSLTLEEKVGMIHGNGLFRTEGVKRLGIPPLYMSDGPMGVRNDFKNDRWETIGLTYDFVTYFPCNMALASTWNPELAFNAGVSLGAEARARGKDVILAPGINIIRSPLCGRNFEYMSEDPYLISKLVVPFIKGVQTQDTAACVKHFAVNNQEHNRLTVEVEADDRALHEIYFPAFKAAVMEGKSYTVMGAYNKLKGEHCCESDYLLNKVLKGEWQFDGVVISDWGAVHNTEKAANNGLDIEMNVRSNFDEYCLAKPLIEKVKAGNISESVIDDKVTRILCMMYRINIFSNERLRGNYNISKHREGALNVARESIVLLKNDKNLLPLNEKVKNITVIGDNANRLHSNGGGSAEIKALYEISPLLGLKMRLGGNTNIEYVRGYSNDESKKNELYNEAIEKAKNSEIVIFIGGLNHDQDTEGKDKENLTLPYSQDDLISKLLEVNKNTVIVNISGSAVDMEKWIDDAHTVVQSFYNGCEGGYALAEVLFGDVNPSGKLSVTFPKQLEDVSAHCIGEFPGDETVKYTESILVGYRHFDTNDIKPRFAFGHGLSYTTFSYNDLKITLNNNEVLVKFKITNTGQMSGYETVQLYVSDIESTLPRPLKELKGFEKIYLNPGETSFIELKLNTADFSYYNDSINNWVFENGEFEILIGSSSDDIRLNTIINL